MRGLGAVLVMVMVSAPPRAEDTSLRQSPGYGAPRDIDEWRAGEERGGLKPYPAAPPGTPNPAGGLSQFGGGSPTSFGRPELGMPFAEWRRKMEAQRPAVDRAAQEALAARFRLDCRTDPKATMSRIRRRTCTTGDSSRWRTPSSSSTSCSRRTSRPTRSRIWSRTCAASR